MRIFRLLFFLAVAMIGLGIVLAVYNYLIVGATISPLAAVPEDAVFILETNEPIAGWKQLSSSPMWQHLRKNAYFEAMTRDAAYLDKLIDENRAIFDLVGSDRSVIISAHLTSAKNYDFLYSVDLGKASRLSALQQLLSSLSDKRTKITQREYQGVPVTVITDTKTKSALHLAFYQNLLLTSYTAKLIDHSITAVQNPASALALTAIKNEIGQSGAARIYFQYALLDEFMRCFMDAPNDAVNDLSRQLVYSGLDFAIDNSGALSAKGITLINDTIASYFQALLRSGTGKTDIASVAPQRTAFYLGLGFSSFGDFSYNLQGVLRKTMGGTYSEYEKNIQKIEKFLKIKLSEHFFGWISDEVAFVQVQPGILGKDNEFAVVLKAKNSQMAKQNLDFIAGQIRKRTPVKFKAIQYEGYPINYLSLKGFFKIVMGKMFSRLERPYYTIIEDFVIFSNHPQTLKSIISDYKAGLTLANWRPFQLFRSQFDTKSNVFIYTNIPTLFPSLKTFADDKTWAAMVKNRQFITCFNQIGLQLTKKSDRFATTLHFGFTDPARLPQPAFATAAGTAYLVDEATGNLLDSLTDAQILEAAPDSEALWLDQISPDDLDAKEYTEKYPDGKPKFIVGLKNGLKHGDYREFYPSGNIRIKGRFRADQKDGLWKEYDEAGNIISKTRYKNGQIEP